MATILRHNGRTHVLPRTRSTWEYFGLFVRHPRRMWSRLLTDPRRVRHGLMAVLVVGLGYMATIAGIALSGGVASPPFLRIDAAEYFGWEVWFVLPVTLLCWILAAAVMHLLSKVFQGHGTFDDTLALAGFAVGLATPITLFPDAVRALLTASGVASRAAWERAIAQPGTPDFVFLWSDMIAYLIGLLVLFPLSVATAQRLARWPAIAVGLAGAIVYQGVYLIFIR